MATLRDTSNAKALECPREDDFSEMLAAIGDQATQERIRKDHPDRHHCFILRESPYACVELPREFGPAKTGQMCPNNPYSPDHPNAAKMQQLELSRRLLNLAVDAHRSLKVGGVNAQSPRIEVVLAYGYDRWLEERQWQKSSNSLLK